MPYDQYVVPVDTFYCSDLTFDYSQVQGGVAANPPLSHLRFHRSGDHLFANAAGLPIEIRVTNLLGFEVLSKIATGMLDLDLAGLPDGVYFAIVESGGERQVKRIAVVH